MNINMRLQHKFNLFFFAAFAAFAACTAQKETLYELPDAMLPHVKVEYAKLCEKGKILYEINCGGCHSTRARRKVVIPDFSPAQLQGYSLRVSNAQHEKNMPDTLVSAEELGVIMTFLSYKKKNPPLKGKR